MTHWGIKPATIALSRWLPQCSPRSSAVPTRFFATGEEFAVILENVTPGQALAVAKRMKDKAQSLRMPHPASTVSSWVTISIGVAVARKDDSVSCGELVLQADKALYHAKNSGRNRICLYEDIDGKVQNAAPLTGRLKMPPVTKNS